MGDKEIGARIRQLREQASISVSDAARICELELSEYQDGEAGTRSFSSRELFKICGELRVSLSDIFAELR